MDEIEAKILEVSHKDLEPKLLEFGAEKVFDGELHAIYFDTADYRLKKEEGSFRIRKEGSKAFMTHKKNVPSSSVKIRDETEVEIGNFEMARKMLNSLGFKETRDFRKKRVSYKIGRVRFEFDKYLEENGFVPEFLEIEAQSEEEVYEWAEKLGFSREDCKPWTFTDMMKYYKRN